MAMPGRSWNNKDYRYGYQGSEINQETYGNVNQYTTEFRQLDSRLGRWFSVDPLERDYPWQSPYCSMDGNPIQLTDNSGLGSNVGSTSKDVKVAEGEGAIAFYNRTSNNGELFSKAKFAALNDQVGLDKNGNLISVSTIKNGQTLSIPKTLEEMKADIALLENLLAFENPELYNSIMGPQPSADFIGLATGSTTGSGLVSKAGADEATIHEDVVAKLTFLAVVMGIADISSSSGVDPNDIKNAMQYFNGGRGQFSSGSITLKMGENVLQKLRSTPGIKEVSKNRALIAKGSKFAAKSITYAYTVVDGIATIQAVYAQAEVGNTKGALKSSVGYAGRTTVNIVALYNPYVAAAVIVLNVVDATIGMENVHNKVATTMDKMDDIGSISPYVDPPTLSTEEGIGQAIDGAMEALRELSGTHRK